MIPIGALVRRLEAALPQDVGRLATPDQAREIRLVYEKFDHAYRNRPDYRLWRRRIYPYYAHTRTGLLPPPTRSSRHWNDWPQDAWLCATARNPVLFWSGVALAPSLMHRPAIMGDSRETAAMMDFSDDLFHRLTFGASPLEQCPASCGLTAVIFLVARQQMLQDMGYWLGLRECQQLFRQIEEWMAAVDPYWTPGAVIRTNAVEVERAGPARLRVNHDAYEYTTLVRTLMKCRPLIAKNIFDWNSEAQTLFDDAYGYAKTAWLTARSRRFDEVRHLDERNLMNQAGLSKIRRSLETEFKSLHGLAVAAREAGEYLEAAKHLSLYIRLLPDQLAEDLEYREKIPKPIYRFIKEAGLEVDPRFRTSEGVSEFYEERQRARAAADTSWPEPGQAVEAADEEEDLLALPLSFDGTRRNLTWRGFALRVMHDQVTNPDWRIVLEQVPLKRRNGIKYLHDLISGLADERRKASPQALEAAFKLAIRYALIRSAGKLLERGVHGEWTVGEDRLMDFVQSVKRSTQLDPFGLDHEKLEKWHALIRDCCSKMAATGHRWIAPENRLWLHELLLSRTHVQFRTLSPAKAWRLYDKAVGSYDVADLREFYDLEYDFNRRAPGIANRQTIANYCASRSNVALGRPVAVSVAVFDGVISALAVGAGGAIAVEEMAADALQEQFKALIAESKFWFQVAGEPDRQITWPPLFRKLGDLLGRLMDKCDPEAQVMLLSIEPFLAQLPWQHLMLTRDDGRRCLVALVPNFSTITLERRREVGVGVNLLLSEEAKPEIQQVSAVVRESLSRLDPRSVSLSVVVAHGERSGTGQLIRLRVGPRKDDVVQSSNDWIDLLGSRTVLLYCCHSGLTEPLYMQELGGIPGLALSMGTETFIAPVSEVFPDAAIALHQELARLAPRVEVGVGYLEAISRNLQCTLFNLYGDPYQPLWLKPPVAASAPMLVAVEETTPSEPAAALTGLVAAS